VCVGGAAIAVGGAGRRGVGPEVKSRFLRSMSPLELLCYFIGYRRISAEPPLAAYNFCMGMIDQIQQDITAAMKARDEQRLSTLRMVKTALKNREIEKMSPLDDQEAQRVLSTLIKQRKDSIEQFTKGGRQEMADKEAAEITLI